MTEENFIDCVKRNNQRLFLIALSFTQNHNDAEDILQNVFLKLWKYDKPFNNDMHLDKWLTAVCVNESKNYIKSPFRKRHVQLDDTKEHTPLRKTAAMIYSMPLCHCLQKSAL